MKTADKLRWGAVRKVIKGDQCVYCGDLANTEEHFPPKSFSARGVILPCCKECNVLAGTLHPNNFEKRAEYVKNRLRKRYRSKMNAGHFTVDEIDEFSGNLKRSVNLWQNQKRVARTRIAWNALAYIGSIDRNNDFVLTYVDLDGTIEKD